MEKILRLFNKKKKVTLREVVAAKPSRTTLRVLSEVLRRAYTDQQAVRHKAQEIRSD